MKRNGWMLLVGVLVLVGITVGAEVRRAEKDVAQDTAAEVVFGTIECAASAIGTVSVTLDFSGGSAGVIGNAGGIELTQLFDAEFDTNEQAAQTCVDTVESLETVAAGANCTTGPIRSVGNRRSFGVVCGGDRTQTVQTVEALGRAVLQLEF
jgi:hypothetical protein